VFKNSSDLNPFKVNVRRCDLLNRLNVDRPLGLILDCDVKDDSLVSKVELADQILGNNDWSLLLSGFSSLLSLFFTVRVRVRRWTCLSILHHVVEELLNHVLEGIVTSMTSSASSTSSSSSPVVTSSLAVWIFMRRFFFHFFFRLVISVIHFFCSCWASKIKITWMFDESFLCYLRINSKWEELI